MNLKTYQWNGGPFIIDSGQVNVAASQTDRVWDAVKVPCRCRLVQALITSEVVTETNAITIDIHNETANKTLVDNEGLATLAAGALATASVITATLDDKTIIEPGEVLLFRYTSGASDTSTGTRVRCTFVPTLGTQEWPVNS